MDSSTISGNATVEEADAVADVPCLVCMTLHHNSIVAGNSCRRQRRPDICGTITDSNGHNLFGSAVDGATLRATC